MSGAGGRRLLLVLCGLAAVTAAGCAELDFLPSWVPFQGPASDVLPGVVPPAQRISELQKLSETADGKTADEKLKISGELANSIRTEKDPLIRVEIIRALGRYPGPAADAILKAALGDTEMNVRVAACEAWGHRSDAQAVSLLSESLRSDVKSDVRLAAAKALGETRNPAAVPALGEALADTDPAMQYRAVQSLKQASGKDLGDSVERWQRFVKGEQPPAAPSLGERILHLFR
jgi:HEAT repeat protein